jgi:hypothetical protein
LSFGLGVKNQGTKFADQQAFGSHKNFKVFLIEILQDQKFWFLKSGQQTEREKGTTQFWIGEQTA